MDDEHFSEEAQDLDQMGEAKVRLNNNKKKNKESSVEEKTKILKDDGKKKA